MKPHTLLLGKMAGLAACWIAAFALPLGAQNYTISSPAFENAAGVSTGGLYSVKGAVSKPDEAAMTGGSYGLAGQFSSVVTVLQTPGGPRLSAALNNGSIVISWEKPAEGWLLESSPVVPGLSWTPIQPATYQTNATRILVTLPASPGHRFYRLHQQ